MSFALQVRETCGVREPHKRGNFIYKRLIGFIRHNTTVPRRI